MAATRVRVIPRRLLPIPPVVFDIVKRQISSVHHELGIIGLVVVRLNIRDLAANGKEKAVGAKVLCTSGSTVERRAVPVQSRGSRDVGP